MEFASSGGLGAGHGVAVAVARFSFCSFFSDSSMDLRETGTWSGGRGTAVCPGVWPPPDDPVATRDAHELGLVGDAGG
eukprot:scaffold250658_cov21-Attheya_sp.AAC.1